MNILKNWIKEIASLFVFIRFKNIWNLKKYLVNRKKQSGICASVYSYYLDKKGSYIGINAQFDNTPYFPHGVLGVFISDRTKIGKNAVIFQQVTIGAVRTKGSKRVGNPIIGDNCYIGAGAKIIGNVRVGDNCRIGANAVVYEDMPDNSIAVCSPTKIIKKKKENDNKFYVLRENGDIEYYENGKFHKDEKELVSN
ncbi:MAG: serine acetyltransferase [Clostridium sp.]|nr:serine acetyltransferase [Clostridium sp.]MCM1444338.1 serine acetyltransferase [Candidatus Amulumruptor caecigallinarius]